MSVKPSSRWAHARIGVSLLPIIEIDRSRSSLARCGNPSSRSTRAISFSARIRSGWFDVSSKIAIAWSSSVRALREVSLPAGHVAERQVRAGRLGLQVPVPVHLVRATEGALRVGDPAFVEEEPGHVHVHLCDARGVGEMRGERHEFGSRFRRLVGDAGFQIREDERCMQASERVGVAELLALQSIEETLEEEDRIANVAQSFETARLARDRVDPLGGGFIREQVLRVW